MAIDVKKLVRRHGALVSAVTALALAAFLFVQEILLALISWVGVLPYLSSQQGSAALSPFGLALWPLLALAVAFGIGFFVSLWLVAPIAEELRVGHVITRAVLATGIASTLVFIVFAIVGVIGAFSPSGGSLAGFEFPWPRFSGDNAALALGRALETGLQTLIGMLPLGVLAGVLLWLWRKDHPPKHPLAGYIDEI
jgi:hypothetical protein